MGFKTTSQLNRYWASAAQTNFPKSQTTAQTFGNTCLAGLKADSPFRDYTRTAGYSASLTPQKTFDLTAQQFSEFLGQFHDWQARALETLGRAPAGAPDDTPASLPRSSSAKWKNVLGATFKQAKNGSFGSGLVSKTPTPFLDDWGKPTQYL